MVNLGQSDVQVANVSGWIGGKVACRSVLHELGMERAAEGDGGEPVLVKKFGQSQFVPGQTMGANTGNEIHDGRMARLQPERELQFLPGRGD